MLRTFSLLYQGYYPYLYVNFPKNLVLLYMCEWNERFLLFPHFLYIFNSCYSVLSLKYNDLLDNLVPFLYMYNSPPQLSLNHSIQNFLLIFFHFFEYL